MANLTWPVGLRITIGEQSYRIIGRGSDEHGRYVIFDDAEENNGPSRQPIRRLTEAWKEGKLVREEEQDAND